MKQIFIVLELLMVASFGAGFDCKKAFTATEKTICQHKYLSLADEAMSDKFKNATAILYYVENSKLTIPTLNKLKTTQRDFINQREFCGTNQECIYNKTLKRYKQIDIILGTKFDCSFPFPSGGNNTCYNQFGYTDKEVIESQMYLAYEKLYSTLSFIEKKQLENDQKKFYKSMNMILQRNEECMPATNLTFCYEKEEAIIKKRTQYLKNRLSNKR